MFRFPFNVHPKIFTFALVCHSDNASETHIYRRFLYIFFFETVLISHCFACCLHTKKEVGNSEESERMKETEDKERHILLSV